MRTNEEIKADPAHGALEDTLRAIVGRRHVLTGASATRRYAQGYRFGSGEVRAVVRPGSLVEQWRVLNACIAAGHIVIPQAANTGLTGGSTPDGTYDRPVVIVSTMRIAGIHLIDGGAQVVCLPGATLYQLERQLSAVGREPHSVIGSSCIGASVVGGVCNNSGGALVRRGPAYTEYALYARVDDAGRVRLHNELGAPLGDDPETILRRVQDGAFAGVTFDQAGSASAATRYAVDVRQVDAATPARFNADTNCLHGASGSAGRVMVFAVRLDSFRKDARTATFYIGSNDPNELATVRRRMLADFANLPVLGEYIHRDAFNLAERYGKDVFLAIERLGTDRLPLLFALQGRFDALSERLGLAPHLSDRLLQRIAGVLPSHLPRRMCDYRDRFAHHLIVRMADDGIDEARALFADMFPSATGDVFECSDAEAAKAMLHRFAVASAAVRYRAVHADRVEDIVALDIALRRDDRDWFERLPETLREPIVAALYYGHFFCHVFHQDYLVARGADAHGIERDLLDLLEQRGAEFPAEHNVGHHYAAKPELASHYRDLDPGNWLNPGIGKTDRNAVRTGSIDQDAACCTSRVVR